MALYPTAGDGVILYSVASALLHFSFLICFVTALLLLLQVYLSGRLAPSRSPASASIPEGGSFYSRLVSRATCLVALLLTIDSGILLYAFIEHKFIVEYVAQYSDKTLPLFYRITAFWAGQAGSLLFWAWSVALGGLCFVLLPTYRRLTPQTKLWFGILFLCIMSFFLLLMALWSNPFATLDFVPKNGRGLNPLLQNPGMIFHPPLLFLGYGGFVVPGCLALAQTLSGNLHDAPDGSQPEEPWGQASRPFILIAWALLTAGIVLGAWWAYMELGWGGYWAWDPVENASLIPWLVASAYLHTAVIGSRRGKLQRTNVFLMALTTISAFFATYLVRSGVVQSLHAFGSGGVGTPLVVFTLSFLYIAAATVLCEPTGGQRKPPRPVAFSLYGLIVLCFAAIILYQFMSWNLPSFLVPVFFFLLLLLPLFHLSPNPGAKSLEDLSSKEGLLLLVAWLLLALSFIILVATMWPVILDTLRGFAAYLPEALRSRIPDKPMGLEPAFYNRTCLPIFSLLAVLLVFCPYRKWKLQAGKTGFQLPRLFLAVLALGLVCAGTLWFFGVRQPVALLAASCALAAIVGIVLVFIDNPALFSLRSTLTAHGVHIGLLLMVLGVAFSGPYQSQYTVQLNRQQTAAIGDYHVLLNELYEGESQIGPDGRPNYFFLEAEVLVADKNGKVLGKLAPQRRLYSNFENQAYAEVSTLFSLGNEIYATLLSVDQDNRATLAINVNPLINWLWIGGTLMSLFPFAGLSRVRRFREEEAASPDSPHDMAGRDETAG